MFRSYITHFCEEIVIGTNILQNNENCIHFSISYGTINIDFFKFVQPTREKYPFVSFYYQLKQLKID